MSSHHIMSHNLTYQYYHSTTPMSPSNLNQSIRSCCIPIPNVTEESILRISTVQTSLVHHWRAVGSHRRQRLQLHGPVLSAVSPRESRPGDKDLRCSPLGEEIGAGASEAPAFAQGHGWNKRLSCFKTVTVSGILAIVSG